ncbi:MAG: 4Fe-4S dicluster domain-containing protein [Promethearchaeota archaeon]|jgi:Fe-S oxidoreductase
MRLSENSITGLNLCLNTRCNICKTDCPEFKTKKLEFNSPRGKLELIFESIEGKTNEAEVVNIVSCVLKCRECETSCPHDIQIPNILLEFLESTKIT